MNIRLAALIIALSAATCEAQENTSPRCPTAKGAYYYEEGNWKPMEITHSMGMKMTGLYTHTIKATFKDRRSPYQVSRAQAQFCLVELIESGRDITLARFASEKNGRELQFGKAGLSGVKIEIEPKNSVPVKVEKQADRVYLVSVDPLTGGEYILLPIQPEGGSASNQSTNLAGYDIGYHP